MKASVAALVIFAAALAATAAATAQAAHPAARTWNAQAAADYLDGRLAWWLQWPNAARDHDTSCVSCHTAAPYAIARPALRRVLGQRDAAVPERAMLAGVVKRVTLWREVEPFYPDQTRGLPKSSESRGTEAVLNALVLAARDAAAGTLTADTRSFFVAHTGKAATNVVRYDARTGARRAGWSLAGQWWFGAATGSLRRFTSIDCAARLPDISSM